MSCNHSNQHTQINADQNSAAMPCHQSITEKSDKSHYTSCDKCSHCIGVSAALLFAKPQPYEITFSRITHTQPVTGFISHEPERFDSPPRYFS